MLLPASDGWRSRMLLTTLQCTGQPPTENGPASGVNSAEAENRGSHVGCLRAGRDGACRIVDAQEYLLGGWTDGWTDGWMNIGGSV